MDLGYSKSVPQDFNHPNTGDELCSPALDKEADTEFYQMKAKAKLFKKGGEGPDKDSPVTIYLPVEKIEIFTSEGGTKGRSTHTHTHTTHEHELAHITHHT